MQMQVLIDLLAAVAFVWQVRSIKLDQPANWALILVTSEKSSYCTLPLIPKKQTGH